MNETDASSVLAKELERTDLTCPIQIEVTDNLIRIDLRSDRVVVYPAVVTQPLTDAELRSRLLHTGFRCDGEESLEAVVENRPDLVTNRELYAIGTPTQIGDRMCFPFVQRDDRGNVRFGFGSPTDRTTGEVVKGTRILAISRLSEPALVPNKQ